MEQTRLEKFPINVLVVEDVAAFAQAVVAMLRYSLPNTSTILVASSFAEARRTIDAVSINVVLLDLTLPDNYGLNTVSDMRSITSAPIVVLSGQDDESTALDALKLGAQDYLLKGDINGKQLIRSINYTLERHRAQQADADRIRLYEQREDFMAALTHDLEKPMMAANRILELMAQGELGKLPDQHVKLLLKLKHSNSTLLAMIRNLVEVYRYEKDLNALEKENTALAKLVNVYLDSVAPILQDKQIEMSVECDENIEIETDRTSMLRVIRNLVENAITFTPAGGRISVRLWNEDSMVFFQVKDNGPGISFEERTRLFRRFFPVSIGRASPVGTGLSLYLCRQIVEAHNGRIWCHSGDEGGATFTVSLPQAVNL